MTLRDKLKFWILLSNYVEMIVRGILLISLPDAIANSLSYVKAYGGTEQRNLPSGFTELEYIQSDGTQWIDTGITPRATKLQVNFKMQSLANTYQSFFGAVANPTPRDGYRIYRQESTAYFSVQSGSNAAENVNTNLNNPIECQTTVNNGGRATVVVNGVTSTVGSGMNTQFDRSMLIFTTAFGPDDAVSGTGAFKLWSFQIIKDDEEKFNGIPAKRNSDNVIGMYDTVSGRFFTNAGTGTFVAGPEVVPTPDAPMNIMCNNGVLKARHQSGLPLGYTLLDSATNASGGYLDTGIIADVDDIEFDIVAKINDSAVISWYILQSRANSSAPIYGISGSQSGNTFIGSFSGVNNPIPYTTAYRTAGHTYHVNLVCKNGTNTLTVEDLTTGDIYTNTATYTFTAATTNIGLFSNINGGTVTSGNTSVTSAYIKKSGVKVLDYVPALQGTTAGFYDKVTGTFKGATAGSFVAGNTVSDPVEIYTDGTVETINLHGKNLFDENGIILGYFYEDNGTYTANANTFTSGKILMNAGTTVTFSRGLSANNVYLRIHAFNSNNEWIGLVAKSASTSSMSVTGTTPANTSYIRVCGAKKATPSTEIDHECQVELGSTATTYENYFNGGTATAEMLLKIGDYQDVQEILAGDVTRKVGIKAFDGTEDWGLDNALFYTDIASLGINHTPGVTSICTHYKGVDNKTSLTGVNYNAIRVGYYNSAYFAYNYLYINDLNITTVTDFKQYLAEQYAAGTPVIVIYPLATATTESVTGQTLQVQAGDNTLEITQASMSGLKLEAKYNKTA